MILREVARAKVNLFLHVLGVRPDGYHRLESWAVFPNIGDHLEVERAEDLSLFIEGPFGAQLSAGEDNLVLKAARALQPFGGGGASVRLQKNLPVASGIGGGSADAAAALRMLTRLWDLKISDAQLHEVALGLGADTPVCLVSKPLMMRGVGDELSRSPVAPACWVALVNPGVAISTPQVFQALAHKRNPPAAPAPTKFETAQEMAKWLHGARNDLEAPAIGVSPMIEAALEALREQSDCLLARMSGSGATCFGLFETQEQALAAADALRARQPSWWVAAGEI